MAKKKKTEQLTHVHDSTLYYRATYVTSAGTREQEVFISDTMDNARRYAAGPNASGRQLITLEEFKEFIESLL